jgi:hypothetical protein
MAAPVILASTIRPSRKSQFSSAKAIADLEAERQTEALEITRSAECAFLRDHLARWAPGFAARVAAAAPLDFYPGRGSAAGDLARGRVRAPGGDSRATDGSHQMRRDSAQGERVYSPDPRAEP